MEVRQGNDMLRETKLNPVANLIESAIIVKIEDASAVSVENEAIIHHEIKEKVKDLRAVDKKMSKIILRRKHCIRLTMTTDVDGLSTPVPLSTSFECQMSSTVQLCGVHESMQCESW
jgi:hypothetical protein